MDGKERMDGKEKRKREQEGKMGNAKSFSERQAEHEISKKQRLMMICNYRQSKEMENLKNPKLNRVSRQLASNHGKVGKRFIFICRKICS